MVRFFLLKTPLKILHLMCIFDEISKLLKSLPPSNFTLLQETIVFLSFVTTFAEINFMNASNCAVVFGQCLLWDNDPGVTTANILKHNNIVEFMITNAKALFPDATPVTVLENLPPPSCTNSSNENTSVPVSKSALPVTNGEQKTGSRDNSPSPLSQSSRPSSRPSSRTSSRPPSTDPSNQIVPSDFERRSTSPERRGPALSMSPERSSSHHSMSPERNSAPASQAIRPRGHEPSLSLVPPVRASSPMAPSTYTPKNVRGVFSGLAKSRSFDRLPQPASFSTSPPPSSSSSSSSSQTASTPSSPEKNHRRLFATPFLSLPGHRVRGPSTSEERTRSTSPGRSFFRGHTPSLFTHKPQQQNNKH